jgi:hypothetical protein
MKGSYSHNWAAARRGGMRRVLENVLAREAPVPPTEVTHLVQSLEVQRSGDRVLFGELTHATLLRAVTNGFQKLSVVAGPILPEVLQDVCERRLGHRDLQQVVAHGDLVAVSCGNCKS